MLPDVVDDGPNKRVSLRLEESTDLTSGFFQWLFSNAYCRRPNLSAIASGPAGEIWVGGTTNECSDIGSRPRSDAYVARIDRSGRTHWARTYGKTGRWGVQSLASLSSGDLIIAGRHERQGWIARITSGGQQLWDTRLGNDKGIAVAALPNDRIAIAGFEATGHGPIDYHDHVAASIIDSSGKLLKRTRIRDQINKFAGSYGGVVSIATTETAIYIMSSWPGLFNPQPIQLAKLTLNGKLLWSTSLPDSIAAIKRAVTTWRSCRTALGVTADGNPLIACARNGQIHLYQFDGISGAYQKGTLPLPECQTNHPAALFLAVRKDGTTILGGSGAPGNFKGDCSWVGRLMATQ